MCFAPTPRADRGSEDVFDLFIVDEEKFEVENELLIK